MARHGKSKASVSTALAGLLLAASLTAPASAAFADDPYGSGGQSLPADSTSYELIGTKATKVARVTGATPAGETLPNPNETKANYALGGTDLGIVWDATTDPAHPKTMVLFGDSFDSWSGDGGGGGGWRSNLLALSEDRDLTDGLTFKTMIADPATPGYAKEIIGSAHDTSGNGDFTAIPAAGVTVGNRHYIEYMQIKAWGAAGRWTTNFSEIAYSDDDGQTWTKSGVKWDSGSKFAQSAYLKDGGYVYMFGTPTGRFGGIYLSRVPEADILTKASYEYWNGTDWTANDETAAVRIVDAPAGELSVAYNAYYDKYIMTYLNEDRAAIALRSSSELTGGWSGESEIATGEEYPALYGAFIHPWSLQGKDLYFLMSQWQPYNVFLMHATLELGSPARNLIADPNFEDQMSGTISAPWALESGNGGVDRNGGLSRSGANNVWLRMNAGWNAIKQVVAVQPHTKYKLTGFIKTGPSNQDGYFGVRGGTGATPLSEVKFGWLDDYTKQTVTFDSGDHTSVTVYTGDWPNGDTWIQLDDYSLVAVDDVAPVVTLNGEAEVTLKLGGTFTDPGAKAIDDIDGDISRRIVVTGSVDTGKSGTYTLTYSAADAERNTGGAVRTVTVLDPVLPEGIGLDREELALEVGDTATLTAAVSPEDADDKRVVWTSHRPAVATVSAAGEVRGVSEGTAIVTATTALGGYTAIAVVSVKPAVGPAAPQWPEGAALTASEIGQTGLKLSWPAASGESPTVAYAVYGGDSLIGETSVSSTVYQVTGLTAGTSYSFTVKAINEAGKWSEGLSASVSTVSSDPGGVGGNPGGANGGTAPDGGTPQVTDGTIAVKARPDAEGNVVVGLSADVIKRAIAGIKDGRLRIKIDVGAETASSTGMAGAAGATSSTGMAGAAGAKSSTGTAGAAGATSSTGMAGAAGATSSTGTAGAAGATSSTGMVGSTSLAGSTGASGTEDSTSLARAIRSIKVQLPLADIVDAGVGEVSVDAGGASVMLRTDVSAGVLAKDAKRLELTIAKADVAALPAESRERIGDRPVYELGLAVDGANPASFGSSGAVRVALDYAPTAGERPGKLVIYFVGDDGKLQPVKRTAYDAASGTIVFEPQHFSRYAVGYADVAFSDLAGAAWAQEMIESLTARQIIGGTGGERFEPGRAVTRAEFLQLLLNALDLKDASATADFSDVATDAWYYGAVAAGAKLGIAQGRSDGTFGAGDTITREDMAVMLSRTTALKGWKGRGLMAALPVSFTDESDISGYAAGAVNELVQAGLINGFTDGTFAPRAETTRAQAAAVIYRLLAPR